MRKWTMSACVVLAWCILPLAAVVGSRGSSRATQADISIASYTRAVPASEPRTAVKAEVTTDSAEPAATWTVRPGDTLSAIAAALAVPGGWPALYAANRAAIGSDPGLIRPGTVLALPGPGSPARYTVAPGDTLSAIAAALAVPGGWPALYAANRAAIGSDPGAIRPGAVLMAPRPARGQAPRPARSRPARSSPARPGRQAPPSASAASRPPRPLHQAQVPAPAISQPARHLTAPGSSTAPKAGMPRWLEDVLLAAAALAAAAFAVEPAAALARRRKGARPGRHARPARPRLPGGTPGPARQAVARARIILAGHERLIVTYCAPDHTVYVLSPPGEDPQSVLRAARLVLPEDTYEDLADHLGVLDAWPLE